MNTPKNFGFVEPAHDEGAYILGGATKLPKIVLQPNGQWGGFLPTYEPQFGEGWDTFSCTVWGSQNCIETILKRIEVEDKEFNFSERYNVILSRIRPPGADPHKVLEDMRNYKLLDDAILPMTESYEEFLTPDPMEQKHINRARTFPYRIWHEWVIYGNISLAEQKTRMIEALRYSPLAVGVYAWAEEGGIYKRMGADTHWCVIFGYEYGKFWLVFDSYDQSIKKLDWDFGFRWVKRLWLEPISIEEMKQQVSILTQIVEIFKKVISLQWLVNSSVGRTLAAWWDYNKTMGAVRSPEWSRTKREFAKLHPKVCAVCGGIDEVQLHHKLPFHLHPELELNLNNLIWLCEANARNCHLNMGHLNSFKSYNATIETDAAYFREKIATRP